MGAGKLKKCGTLIAAGDARRNARWPGENFVLRQHRFRARHDPPLTRDGVLRVASLDDLMATKLKATLDRAEARPMSG